MEIANIFFQVAIFVLFFSISFPFLVSKFDNNLNYLDQLVFNIIIQINLILFLSFLNVSLKTILIVYFIYLSICVLFQLKNIIKIKLILKKENYFYLFLLIICLALCLDVSYSLTLGWDAQKFWIPKALNFYNYETIDNLSNVPNPQYPFLGSLLWATFWKISFFPEEYTGRLVYVFLYCVSLASLTETLKLSSTIKIIFFTILILLSYNYIRFDGHQDILIFCLISIGAKTLYTIISDNQKISLYQTILLILICNALIWTKQEGTVYAFIIIFTLFFFSKISLYKRIVFLGLVILLFSARIFIYKFYNLEVSLNSCCWSDLSLNALIEKFTFDRIITIIKFFLFIFLKNSFFLLGLVFLIISFFSNNILKKDMYIYFFYLMSYGFIFSAYITSELDLIFMLKSGGLDRLIFSSSPLYILIVTRYINAQNLKI